MSQSGIPDSVPLQFETAEYAEKPDSEQCSHCNQPIIDSYYRLNDRSACPTCVELAKTNQLKTDGSFFRGLLFGIGAAIVGLIIYSAFAIATGWVIGYLSLAVGYIIAKAMLKGTGGVGGRKLQFAAVFLTYSAVSLAAIPVAIHQYSGDKSAGKNQVQTQTAGTSQNSKGLSDTSQKSGSGEGTRFLSAIASLLMLGLASPFLELSDGISGVLGLVILFVGINIAWNLTKGAELQILGPFSLKKQQ
jgi:hypothetical protein